MCDMYICREKGIVTEAGKKDNDGYGDRTKEEYSSSRIHISVSVD